jgi:hypothetical protein
VGYFDAVLSWLRVGDSVGYSVSIILSWLGDGDRDEDEDSVGNSEGIAVLTTKVFLNGCSVQSLLMA